MDENPFSLDFGATPNLYIPRFAEMNKIVSTFSAEMPSTHIFMIMGACGSGKTVLMSTVTEELMKGRDWIHADLSPESDMMEVLAASLYHKARKKYSKIRFDFNVDLKIMSAGGSVEEDEKYANVYTDLDSIFEGLRDRKIKTLITGCCWKKIPMTRSGRSFPGMNALWR
ncbi:MAG: hypothetical protein IJU50_08265 [Lachnospiraceae bacterium]|nr:hypothetical protein [Lachnospiraceae bacterium]